MRVRLVWVSASEHLSPQNTLAAMAPAGKASSFARFDERQRLLFVSVVTRFLDADDVAKAFDGCFPLAKLNVKRPKKSPIAQATDFIMSSESLLLLLGYSVPLIDEKKARESVRHNCSYWFRAIALNRERKSLADEPRATKSDEGLTNGDFQWLGHVLQEQVWRDSHGNMRRHPGLEAMLQGCTHDSEAAPTEAERDAARRVADRLRLIKATATGGGSLSLDNLLERVATKCGCVGTRCCHALQHRL